MTERHGDKLGPVLDRLRIDAPAYFGVPEVELTPVVLSERPFSTVARVRATLSPGQDRFLYVKLVKPRSSEADARRFVAWDFDINRQTYLDMLPHKGLGAVPPVACYPDLLALVTEAVEGPTLLDYLVKHAAWVVSAKRLQELKGVMRSVGRWLRVFQGQPTDKADALTVRQFQDYVDIRLRRLVAHENGRFFSSADRERILEHVAGLERQIRDDELTAVRVHADMSLGNVIVAEGKVVVLDFWMADSGGRLQDISRLFVQADMLAMKPHVRLKTVRALQSALLAGFDPTLTDDRPLFRLNVLLHRVNNLTSLTLNPAPFPESWYNRLVCRAHRRWIADELSR
jgi:hypothetical protein